MNSLATSSFTSHTLTSRERGSGDYGTTFLELHITSGFYIVQYNTSFHMTQRHDHAHGILLVYSYPHSTSLSRLLQYFVCFAMEKDNLELIKKAASLLGFAPSKKKLLSVSSHFKHHCGLLEMKNKRRVVKHGRNWEKK